MSTIEKLKSVKNKILDEVITKENVTKCKNSLILKGSYFKHLFSCIFLKKLKIEKIETPVEHFFMSVEYNFPKVLAVYSLGISGLSTFLDFLFGNQFILSIFSSGTLSVLYIIIFFILGPYIWSDENQKVNEKFNPENLSEIKETMFENYTEKEIEQLLNVSLKKQDLVKIFKEIKEVIGEKYFLETFKTLNLHKKGKSISDPYSLLLIINEIIENKKELDYENIEIKRNEKIMNSLLKEKECLTV